MIDYAPCCLSGFFGLIPSEILFGMKVHITTEDIPSDLRNEKAIIMMNHRTRLDWLYYWSVVMRQGKLENEKIILKNELKQIPGAGMSFL